MCAGLPLPRLADVHPFVDPTEADDRGIRLRLPVPTIALASEASARRTIFKLVKACGGAANASQHVASPRLCCAIELGGFLW